MRMSHFYLYYRAMLYVCVYICVGERQCISMFCVLQIVVMVVGKGYFVVVLVVPTLSTL